MKPNVILMLVDDLGYGDLSCFNAHSQISTPNIDALAGRGMKLTDCHATSALCSPSRYGLLTGRYNWRSRLKSSVLHGGADPLLEPGRMTLGNLFQQNGYFTAAVGKWHMGLGWQRKEIDGSEYGIADEVAEKLSRPNRSPFLLDGMDIDFEKPLTDSPNDHGFDYFFGTAASLDQPPYVYIENRRALSRPDHVDGVFPLDRSGATQQQLWQRGPMAADFCVEQVVTHMNNKVLDLIDTHADKPFFLYYPTHAVHGPLLPPEDFRGKSGLNVYADMVLYLDHMVGEITAKLKERGIWENTIFIFTSDNGCSGVADYPLLLARGHNPSYVFRGRKSEIYEGGHRVPAILSWPARYPTAHAGGQMTCLSDLFATFADLLGTPLPDNAAEDSVSLLPILDGGDSPVRDCIVHSSGDGSFSIRNQDWKLELCRHNGVGMGQEVEEPSTTDAVPYQLYHLVADIGETANLAPAQPRICLDLTRRLLTLIQSGRSTPGAPQENAQTAQWTQLAHVEALLRLQSAEN